MGLFFYQALLAQMHTWELMIPFPSHTLIYWLLSVPARRLMLAALAAGSLLVQPLRCRSGDQVLGSVTYSLRINILDNQWRTRFSDAAEWCDSIKGNSALPAYGGGVLLCCFQLTLFGFPSFRVPFISTEKEKDRLECGAEASVVPPISLSRGFICGGGVCMRVRFCGLWGIFSGGWRNIRIQVLLKPEKLSLPPKQKNLRLTFPILNGMFQERF